MTYDPRPLPLNMFRGWWRTGLPLGALRVVTVGAGPISLEIKIALLCLCLLLMKTHSQGIFISVK